jgi:hypothetical protein
MANVTYKERDELDRAINAKAIRIAIYDVGELDYPLISRKDDVRFSSSE